MRSVNDWDDHAYAYARPIGIRRAVCLLVACGTWLSAPGTNLTGMSDRPVFHTLALDCPDPRALAAFYVDLLGYTVSPDSDDEWVTITGARAADELPALARPPAADVAEERRPSAGARRLLHHRHRFRTPATACARWPCDRPGQPAHPIAAPRLPGVRRPSRAPVLPVPTHPRRLVTAPVHSLRPGESNRHRGDPGPTHGSAASHYHATRIAERGPVGGARTSTNYPWPR